MIIITSIILLNVEKKYLYNLNEFDGYQISLTLR